jgi:hypothetical protein
MPESVEFVQEVCGKKCPVRLVYLIWGIGIFLVWSFLSIKHSKFEPIDDSVIMFFGLAVTGKVIQKPFEDKIAEKNENKSN